MLGDNLEKSKNPLKKAMRRRNAKTVQFSSPTYYEPSEYEYSDDEEDEDGQNEAIENAGQLETQESEEGGQQGSVSSTAHAGNTQQNGALVNGVERNTNHEISHTD